MLELMVRKSETGQRVEVEWTPEGQIDILQGEETILLDIGRVLCSKSMISYGKYTQAEGREKYAAIREDQCITGWKKENDPTDGISNAEVYFGIPR
jgi:hypothetical protein